MDRRKFITNVAVALASAAVAKVSGVADVLSGTSKKNKTMKIVVPTGSPRRGGNSAYLAEQFIKGHAKADTIYTVTIVLSGRWSRAAPATVAAWTGRV